MSNPNDGYKYFVYLGVDLDCFLLSLRSARFSIENRTYRRFENVKMTAAILVVASDLKLIKSDHIVL